MTTKQKFKNYLLCYSAMLFLSFLLNYFLIEVLKIENRLYLAPIIGFFTLIPFYFIYKNKYLKFYAYDDNLMRSLSLTLRLLMYPIAAFFIGCAMMMPYLVFFHSFGGDLTFFHKIGMLFFPPAIGMWIIAAALYYSIYDMPLGNIKQDLLTPALNLLGYNLKKQTTN